ncbi:MAG TPA: 2OG-Fe(II) oxygenase [Candidatus Binataceae bacterium]|nr:2OG-Fe(II) oxygenase [Candidatus Binataceae bacterium]
MILRTGPAPHWFCDPSFGQGGSEFHNQYVAAKPFPYIVLDDFLDEELASFCLREFPQRPSSIREFARSQENKKLEYKPETLSPSFRSLFYAFNSAPFIQFLQNLTGIKGLIPDPYFGGGGLHEVANGGHLSIHADFNHHREMDLERRINVLIYLNRDWKEEYGGCFEIWDRSMSERSLRVVPLFNRCVIFNTSSTSFHGNPDPVNHPEGASRRSIALYYYTATWDRSRREHSTQFRVRPDSRDEFDLSVRLDEIASELAPPIALRAVRRLINGVRRRLTVDTYG